MGQIALPTQKHKNAFGSLAPNIVVLHTDLNVDLRQIIDFRHFSECFAVHRVRKDIRNHM